MANSTTESRSHYDGLEKKSPGEILNIINQEDKKVAHAVEEAIPQIEALVSRIIPRMKEGGRLFYIGAGTSGRLGIVDASECPPTYGVPNDVVIGVIAGGDGAIRKAVEFAEDDADGAWRDLDRYRPNENDTLIGIAASGRTPYVIGGVKKARSSGLLTGCITNNLNTALAESAEFPIEVVVGPEVVTGSTRMKAGTAQKLVLNMVSTAVMIGLGRVRGHQMVDMQLSNNKLFDRGIRMILEEFGISEREAQELLNHHGSIRAVISHLKRP